MLNYLGLPVYVVVFTDSLELVCLEAEQFVEANKIITKKILSVMRGNVYDVLKSLFAPHLQLLYNSAFQNNKNNAVMFGIKMTAEYFRFHN